MTPQNVLLFLQELLDFLHGEQKALVGGILSHVLAHMPQKQALHHRFKEILNQLTLPHSLNTWSVDTRARAKAKLEEIQQLSDSNEEKITALYEKHQKIVRVVYGILQDHNSLSGGYTLKQVTGKESSGYKGVPHSLMRYHI